jgi:hypothetical protein
VKLTQEARDTLYEGRINPIATFSDVGTLTIFSQHTHQPSGKLAPWPDLETRTSLSFGNATTPRKPAAAPLQLTKP